MPGAGGALPKDTASKQAQQRQGLAGGADSSQYCWVGVRTLPKHPGLSLLTVSRGVQGAELQTRLP